MADPTRTADFNCQSCGICCVVYAEAVPVYRDDLTPRHMTRSVRGLMGFASWEHEEGTRRMASNDGRCIALRGTVGRDCRCHIYDRRPAVCRDFEPGSSDCIEARKGLQNVAA